MAMEPDELKRASFPNVLGLIGLIGLMPNRLAWSSSNLSGFHSTRQEMVIALKLHPSLFSLAGGMSDQRFRVFPRFSAVQSNLLEARALPGR